MPRTAVRSPVTLATPWLSLLRMRALARSQIPVQLINVLENGHTRKSFNNVEYFPNLRLQMDERGLPAALLQLLAGRGKDPQTCTADEFQPRKIKDELFDSALLCQKRGKVLLQFGSGDSVEAAGEFNRGGGARCNHAILDLNFE